MADPFRSKYHVPLQSTGVALTFFGAWLGHHHGGREFPSSVSYTRYKLKLTETGAWCHGQDHCGRARYRECNSGDCKLPANLLQQTACGIFLKLHILEKTVRPWIVLVHGILGKFFPVIGWTRE
jgi:hypothetical protein